MSSKILIVASVLILAIAFIVLNQPENSNSTDDHQSLSIKTPIKQQSESTKIQPSTLAESTVINPDTENKSSKQFRYKQADCVKEILQQDDIDFVRLTSNLSPQQRDELLRISGIEDGAAHQNQRENQHSTQAERNRVAAKRFKLLSEKYAKEKDNLTALTMLELCSSRLQDSCTEKQIKDIAYDFKDNAYTLFYLANYYKERDAEQFEQTIDLILQANEVNLLRKEFITQYYDYHVSIGMTPLQAIIRATGSNAARWQPTRFIYDYCSENDYNQRCQQLTQFVSEKSGDLMLEITAKRTLQKFWELNGRSDLAEEIAMQIISEWNEVESYARVGMPYDDEVADITLRALDYTSEHEAMKFIHTEAQALIERKPDICIDNPITKKAPD